MATLTLRGTKGSPLTHVELDANFTALDSDLQAGSFDSGLDVQGGIVINDGDLNLSEGNLVLNAGDIHYNPKLGFYDLSASLERARFDSTGSLLIGSSVNSQDVNLKVARSGNQHILMGNKTSQNGQTTFLQLGAAGNGTEKSCGFKATQVTANFEDWKLSLVSYNGSQYIDAIEINPNGNIDINTEIEFHDSATFNNGISISGDLTIDGGQIIVNGGGPIASGTVESVGLIAPTGFDVFDTPVTSVGNITLGYSTNYSRGLPSNTKQEQWDSAYGWGDHSEAGYVQDSVLGTYFDSVLENRVINTGNGLQGGGNLDSDLTLAMDSQYTGNFTINSGDFEVIGDSYTNGDVRASGDVISYYNVSDERLKTDIRVIDNALEKVNSLKGVQFEYQASGIKSTGLIAQDLEPILPEAIFEDEDGYKGIRYQLTVGLLVEAIKELKAEIEELKKGK